MGGLLLPQLCAPAAGQLPQPSRTEPIKQEEEEDLQQLMDEQVAAMVQVHQQLDALPPQ